MNAPLRILFVCTGNICRSPTAEGVARGLAERDGLSARFIFDSAGTHGYHVGEPPDRRSIAHAAQRGYDLSRQRARRLASADFQDFDHLLALDHEHLTLMRERCPQSLHHKLRLFLDFSAARRGEGVPDPYYGGAAGFDHVLDLIEHGSAALIDALK